MQNLFELKTQTILETESTKYISDGSIPTWIALRYIELSEVAYSGRRELNRISTTQFSNSDKQILLDQRRIAEPYKIERDVAQLINSVNGSVLHEAILVKEPDRMEKSIGKFKISGQTDRINDGVLYDLKHTSTLAGKHLFRELEVHPNYDEMSLEDLYTKCPTIFKFLSQLSIYSWLYNLENPVGYISFVFNNWTFMDKSVIPNRITQVELKLASHEKVLAYLTKRLERLEGYQKSGYLPTCPDSTLGISKSSTFKVTKYGPTNNRAINGTGGAHNTLEAASIAQAKATGPSEIKEFKESSTPILCLRWCEFNIDGICEQGQTLRAQND